MVGACPRAGQGGLCALVTRVFGSGGRQVPQRTHERGSRGPTSSRGEKAARCAPCSQGPPGTAGATPVPLPRNLGAPQAARDFLGTRVLVAFQPQPRAECDLCLEKRLWLVSNPDSQYGSRYLPPLKSLGHSCNRSKST